MFAILPSLGIGEIILLLVLGVVLFGRNLPEVGKSLGRTIGNLRRGLHDFKSQLDRDDDLRDIRDTMRKTRQEMRDLTAVPRNLRNPGGALRDLANEAMAPLPDDEPDSQRPDDRQHERIWDEHVDDEHGYQADEPDPPESGGDRPALPDQPELPERTTGKETRTGKSGPDDRDAGATG